MLTRHKQIPGRQIIAQSTSQNANGPQIRIGAQRAFRQPAAQRFAKDKVFALISSDYVNLPQILYGP